MEAKRDSQARRGARGTLRNSDPGLGIWTRWCATQTGVRTGGLVARAWCAVREFGRQGGP